MVARGDDVRVLVRASSSNRAISDLPLEYVTGICATRPRWNRDERRAARVSRAADYRLWRSIRRTFTIRTWRDEELLAARSTPRRPIDLPSTVATIAVDRPNSQRIQEANLEEMIGHYSARNGCRTEVLNARRKVAG